MAWIEPHALVLVFVLPLVIRIVGHWLPEELFMVAVGVLAARRSPTEAAALLGAMWAGQFLTDQAVFTVGRILGRRLERWHRIRPRIEPVLVRLKETPAALWGLVPARVLPLGRGAWLLATGAVGISRARFLVVDTVALILHTVLWSGLGWLAQDHAAAATEVGMAASFWLAVALILSVISVTAWRRTPALVRFRRRAGFRADRG